jgi:hypothetical protein
MALWRIECGKDVGAAKEAARKRANRIFRSGLGGERVGDLGRGMGIEFGVRMEWWSIGGEMEK